MYYIGVRHTYCIKLNKFVVELIKPISGSYYGRTSLTWLFSMVTLIWKGFMRGVCVCFDVYLPLIVTVVVFDVLKILPRFPHIYLFTCCWTYAYIQYTHTHQRLRNKTLMMASSSIVLHVISFVPCSKRKRFDRSCNICRHMSMASPHTKER